ncbi:MAG: hypothetical protein R3F39_25025 [Myxococcota bacterium]
MHRPGSRKHRRCLAILGIAALLGGCAATDPRTAPERHRSALLQLEQRLAPEALRYAGEATADAPPRADGVAVLGDALWVWSADGPELAALRDTAAGFARAGEAAMSAGATRCLGGAGALAGALFCAGPRVTGGVEALGASEFTSRLPPRGGFRDLALDSERGLIHVLDGVTDRLMTLDRRGEIVASVAAPPGVYRLASAGPAALVLLAGPAPHITLQPLDARGLPAPPARALPHAAPARDAVYDPARATLWLVGPEAGPPRRQDGPLRHLRSALVGLPLDAPAAAPHPPPRFMDLGALGLVDATRVVLVGRHLAVAATGSDAVAFIDPDTEPPAVTTYPTGAAPVGLAAAHGAVYVAHRADASVARVEPTHGVTARIALATLAPDDPRSLGARLFYGAHVWRSAPGDAVTCNTCHWDTGSDHRLQPGFLERRRELTRPLGGIGAVSPIFTTSGADSLAQAVEGLVRGLDERFWQSPPDHSRYWERPVTLPLGDGSERHLSPRRLREALMTFLATLPREPGPLRVGAGPDPDLLRRGFALFARDCAACHALAPDVRRPERLAPDDALTWLATRGLAFSQPGWSRVGITPSFHPQGHRVAPLSDLGRPGPFFSNASAPTLRDAVDRLRPGSAAVHGGQPGTPATLAPAEQEALLTFLLWL